MSHPYSALPDYCFWRRAVASIAPGQLDPVLRAPRIQRHEKIATIGSCFSQQLARRVAASGFHYFIAEQADPALSKSAAEAKGYGVFSARYGNVYTARQALQLLKRAFEPRDDEGHIWRRGDAYVDGFRPQVEPDGFVSYEAAIADRKRHLACVRDVFTQSDWLLFTLGLTEAWRSKKDGSIFPLAPGVAGGEFSSTEHEFVNFTASEVTRDLRELVDQLAKINPTLKIILTVSPQPTIASCEDRHVAVSNTVSKAILRVAADEVERACANVSYFPSYEVVVSPASMGRYYGDDLRLVTEEGIRHVWRLFTEHFFEGRASSTGAAMPDTSALVVDPEVVCDEEEIERSLAATQR